MDINYKIIGGDGHEYGPATLDELKGWIRDGRVGRQTQILRSDLENWLPASQFQELQSELPAMAAAAIQEDFDAVGFWPRVGAVIIDGILIYFIVWALWIPLANLMGWPTEIKFDSNSPVRGWNDLMPIFMAGAKQTIFSFILRLIYEVLMTGKWGATVGKMIIGAKIVRVDGSPLGYDFALYRFLAKIVSDFTCYIGYLMVAFREDKRGLHDLIARTRVIYKR